MNNYFRLFLVVVFLASSVFIFASPARTQAATTIRVVTALELIHAIIDANSETGDYVGPDRIILDADIFLYDIDPNSSNVGGGRAGLPDITSTITIQAGDGSIIRRELSFCRPNDGIPDFRLFNIMNGSSLTLNGIIVQDGCIAPAASYARGGGIYIDTDSSLTLTNAVVAFNDALGGVRNDSGYDAQGGGIFSQGTITTITNCIFSYNTAKGGGGLVYGGEGEGGAIFSSGEIGRIANSSIAHNKAIGGSGTNEGGDSTGGGIALSGEITRITNTTLASNNAQAGDGGEYGGSAQGGGIHISNGRIGKIVNSTIALNRALAGDGRTRGGDGEGGAIQGGEVMSIANNTIASNRAQGGHGGAPGGGHGEGGGLWLSHGNTIVFSSILADNIAVVADSSTPEDCVDWGDLSSGGYNVVEAPGDCPFTSTTDQTNVDPVLGTLTDNGCTVPLINTTSCITTMAITNASPAYDQGSCGSTAITQDARGADYVRPQDDPAVANASDGCDSGAFEAAW